MPAFTGQLIVGSADSTTTSPVGIKFFSDAALTQNFSGPGGNYSAQNPLYFGTWATGQMGVTLSNSSDLIYESTSNGASWILSCSATVFDISYNWVDSAVASFNTTTANGTVGGILSAAFVAGLASNPLENGAILAGLSASSTDLARITADHFSQSALALAIGAVVPRPNILQQMRSTTYYTRVPKIPFFVLIGLKLSYGLAAILFALAVVKWAHPRESQDIKARLSFQGLVAASFEQEEFKSKAVDDLKDIFAENSQGDKGVAKKVAMVQTSDGGWAYASRFWHGGEMVTELVQAVTSS